MEVTKLEIALTAVIGLLFTANSLGTSIMVGLGNSVWSTMTAQGRFVMCVGIFVNWSGTMMAWMNRSISNLQRGKLPLPPAPGGSSDTTILTKSDVSAIPTPMKAAIALIVAGWLILIFGCTSFSTNVFRTEQTVTGVAMAAYSGYTNALQNGTLKISEEHSNAVRTARLQFAASVGTLEMWRAAYQTNSAVQPQVQAALDAAIDTSSNFVYLVKLFQTP